MHRGFQFEDGHGTLIFLGGGGAWGMRGLFVYFMTISRNRIFAESAESEG